MKKLALILPLGTLVALLLAFLVARWSDPRAPIPPVAAAAGASLPPMEFPDRSGRLASRVEDVRGAPVARATVWLQSGAELAFTESAADGAFEFDRVQPGGRELFVVAEGFSPQRFSLAAGAVPEHLVLTNALAAPPTLPPMRRSTLRGAVRAEAFAAEGCQVCLAPRLPPETLGAPLPVRAECAADGTFVFEGLIEGDYTVQVFPRWAANGSWPDLLRPLAGTEPAALHHAAGEHADGLVLQPVSARVTGTLRDTSLGALEGALVLVTPTQDPTRVWPPVTSDAKGAFACGELPPGKYSITVRAGGDTAQVEVELGASEARELIVRPLDVGRVK